MQTRAKSSFSQPRLERKLLLTNSEPKYVKHTIVDLQYNSAMQVEYDALIQNKTWSLVPLPPYRQANGCKWVFRV